MSLHKRNVAKRGSEEQVRFCPASDEEFRNFRPVADQVLRWGRVVIIIARIDLGATFEQKSGDRDRASEMQWPLAVATPGTDDGGIVRD